MIDKGILLAGGHGTRLQPLTIAVNKHLLPVFDKPMVYYPLSVLMLARIRQILVVTTDDSLPAMQRLLGNGSEFGLQIDFQIQAAPNGLAEGLRLGRDFIADDSVALMLGDNVLYGQGLPRTLVEASTRTTGATVFAYQVPDPERYGVVELSKSGQPIALTEKPTDPRSNLAITGLYFYDNRVLDIADNLRPSERGELEITDVNREYLRMGALHVSRLGRGIAWLDSGTFDSLLDASNFIATLERRQGFKVACIEEISWRQGWISTEQLLRLANRCDGSDYGEYLRHLPEVSEPWLDPQFDA